MGSAWRIGANMAPWGCACRRRGPIADWCKLIAQCATAGARRVGTGAAVGALQESASRRWPRVPAEWFADVSVSARPYLRRVWPVTVPSSGDPVAHRYPSVVPPRHAALARTAALLVVRRGSG